MTKLRVPKEGIIGDKAYVIKVPHLTGCQGSS